MRIKTLPFHLCVVVLLLTLCVSSWAQFAQRSGIGGFVTDASGAVVVSAKVTLKDLSRNQETSAMTDATGHYEFTQLNLGRYEVDVEKAGFKKATSEPIELGAQDARRYDLKLVPGATLETVEVSGTEPLIQTEQTSVQQSIDARQVETLPMNGRNFTSLAALLPAVSTSPRANINTGGTFDVGATFSAGGTQYYAGGVVEGSRDNGFYINGVNTNENYQGSISYAPSPEAIQEVKVQISDFSAANGHDITAFNVSTRGGTNSFHGSVYDYIENDAFNAISPYDKAQAILSGSPVAKPSLRRNQFGGNFGGPVYIPHVLNLKDRAFFFVNYERFPERDGGGNQFGLVPTDPERTGDFSGLCQGGFTAGICNDLTLALETLSTSCTTRMR